jgi:hypothetical protein
MALTAPRILYGIHSLTPYSTSTGLYYGIVRVLKGSVFSLSGEVMELRGGSSRYPWANEDGNISGELNINCAEYPDFLFELFLGKDPTDVAAEASGNASTFTDKYGTTVVDAAGFLSTVTVGTAADLKFGKYIVKATGTNTASVYCSTNIDAVRGTDASDFTDDTLLIASLTGIGSGSTHAITGYGITLTAGASAGGMTTGHTATFEVRPVTTGVNITATMGGLSDVFPEFGALLYSAQRGNQEMFELDVFKMKAIGCSLGAEEKSFSSWNVTAKAAYDSARSGVFSIRHVRP